MKWFLGITLLALSECTLMTQLVAAQITPDATLGQEGSILISDVLINGETGDRIDGGARRGANLFHSFQEFNINEGQRVYFNNPAGVENILSRVTGNGVSDIQGTLGVIGNANLFLLNPNGIIFGSNARLDVNGSFTATTADAIQFDNQGFFSAVNPEVPTLLTVNPSAFWFNQLQRGSITNRSLAPAGFNPIGQAAFGLRVEDGSTLTLLGGNVSLDRGRLNAFGGRVEIGAVAGLGAIALNPDGSLDFPVDVERSDVSLTNGSAINTAAGGGGGIAINARNINLSGGSTLTTGILSGLGGEGVRSGDIRLDATVSIEVRQSQVSTNTFGQGDAGNITLSASDRIQLVGDGRQTTDTGEFALFRNVASNVEPGAIGDSGNIHISARSISATSRSGILAETWSWGDAGSIILRATEDVLFDDGFVIANVLQQATGQAGQIDIQSRTLSINASTLDASTFGRGNAGNIYLNIAGSINLRAANVSSSIVPNAIGNGGVIRIRGQSLSLVDGSIINSYTAGQGNAGNIVIHTTEPIVLGRRADELEGQTLTPNTANVILTAVFLGGTGRGGNIDISAQSLSMFKGAAIASATYEQGRAGNINVQTRDFVLLDGVDELGAPAAIISNVTGIDEPAQGGNISINTSRLQVMNGAVIDASAGGYPGSVGGEINIKADTFTAINGGQINNSGTGGRAGSITLTITDQIILSGRDPTFQQRVERLGRNFLLQEGQGESGLFANTRRGSVGTSGSIFVRARGIRIQDGAAITVSNQSGGEAGNIEMRAGTLKLSNQAQISAETLTSNGGEIVVQLSDYLLMRDRSNITTEAGTERAGGNGGNIRINAPFVVAVPGEDSNINANAFQGNGGNISIATQGLLGLQVSDRSTPLSDITASSEFGVTGTVTITTPDVEPSRGLLALPSEVVDASNQVSQTCTNEASATASEFIITGRGGLPPNPTQILSSNALIPQLAEWDETSNYNQPPISQPESVIQSRMRDNPSLETHIMEAQGWVMNDRGHITLVAQAPVVTPNSSNVSSTACANS
jgi:filamentous hemagglutinin family protein